MREIRTEAASTRINGRHAIVDIPVIPADACPELAEGLRRRRVAALRGRCPCGARRPAAQLATSKVQLLRFPHEPSCPAHEDLLAPLVDAWQQQEVTCGGVGPR